MTLRRLRNARGDTIVEVLISIAVISLVLAGAYSTTNHSLTETRDAKEHEEALTLGQSQLEIMNATTATLPASFCFNASSSDAVVASTPTSPATACQITNAGSNYAYTILITKTNTPSPPQLATYKVQVTWPSLFGTTDSVQLYYQPPNNTTGGDADASQGSNGSGSGSSSSGSGSGSSGSGGSDGSVGIGNGCGPGQCTTGNYYHPQAHNFYAYTFGNNTVTDGSTIVACTWKWTTSTSSYIIATANINEANAATAMNNAACYPGEALGYCFPYPPNGPQSDVYTVTLSVQLADGVTVHPDDTDPAVITTPTYTTNTYNDGDTCYYDGT
jgi:type II secretory pathway pseudopilin PulG